MLHRMGARDQRVADSRKGYIVESDWNELDSYDTVDEFNDEDENPTSETASPSAESASDVAQQVQRGAAAEVQEAHAHDNLTFLNQHRLHDGPRSIKIAQAVIVRRHEDNSYKGMYLIYEAWGRRSRSLRFQRQQRVVFDIDATSQLVEYLRQAEAAAEVQSGAYVVLPAAEVFDNLDEGQQQTFSNLLNDIARSRRVAELLATGQISTDVVENLAAAAQHARYKAALAELDDMVSGKVTKDKRGGGTSQLNEHDFQKWFERHTWVFGTEYLHRLDFRAIDPHAAVDFILETADGFFDVLELKTPSASVLVFDSSHKTWYWSTEAAKVIAQAAKYLKAIERNADRIYRDEKVLLVRPRVRAVIGRSHGWADEQHEAFRRLSATLHGIDLMTFDHVMLRAQQLVNCYEHHPDLHTVVPAAISTDEP